MLFLASFVTFIMTFYMFTYFGFMGNVWKKFYNRANSGGPPVTFFHAKRRGVRRSLSRRFQ